MVFDVFTSLFFRCSILSCESPPKGLRSKTAPSVKQKYTNLIHRKTCTSSHNTHAHRHERNVKADEKLSAYREDNNQQRGGIMLFSPTSSQIKLAS